MVMTWSVADAKAKLSEVLERASEAPQFIESRGRPKAVVVSAEAYAQLVSRAEAQRPSGLQEFIEHCAALAAEGPMELEIPARAFEADRATELGEA